MLRPITFCRSELTTSSFLGSLCQSYCVVILARAADESAVDPLTCGPDAIVISLSTHLSAIPCIRIVTPYPFM